MKTIYSKSADQSTLKQPEEDFYLIHNENDTDGVSVKGSEQSEYIVRTSRKSENIIKSARKSEEISQGTAFKAQRLEIKEKYKQ